MTTKMRIITLLLLSLLIIVLGLGIQTLPDFDRLEIAPVLDSPVPDLVQPKLTEMANPQLHVRFNQAVAMLHAKKYELAFPAFHEVLNIAPEMPEAHVNMGFTLIGLGRHQMAKDFFSSALALNPEQANAYYGFALVHEQEGDYPLAINAMQTYLHRTDAKTDEAYLVKARAAIWEWQEALAGKTGATEGSASEQQALGNELNQ